MNISFISTISEKAVGTGQVNRQKVTNDFQESLAKARYVGFGDSLGTKLGGAQSAGSTNLLKETTARAESTLKAVEDNQKELILAEIARKMP